MEKRTMDTKEVVRVQEVRDNEEGPGDGELVNRQGIQGRGRGGARGDPTQKGGRGQMEEIINGETIIGEEIIKGARKRPGNEGAVSRQGSQGRGRGGARGDPTQKGGRGQMEEIINGEEIIIGAEIINGASERPGDEETVSRQGIKGRGRGGRGRRRGVGGARGEPTQKGGGGQMQEIINGAREGQNRGPRERKGQGESRRKGPDIVGEPEESVMETKGDTTGKGPYLDKDDFQQLLRLLHIKLPVDITSHTAIEISKAEQSLKDAETLIQDLKDFKLAFRSCPGLPSRKVKRALALKEHGNVLELSRLIFFEKNEKKSEKSQSQWKENTFNTGRGFKLREKYMSTPISTPQMYSTARTRSWKTAEGGTDSPRVTQGTRVNRKDIEGRDFADEASLWNGECIAKKFGKNDADEEESLNFFLGLREAASDYRNATFTKGSSVHYGFLTGTLDFLAEVNNDKKKGVSKRLVIECKSTAGDMVDKLYTKTPDSQNARVEKDHKYSIQVQTYLYILDEVAKTEPGHPDTTAVMILRHYHKDCNPLRDFHWTFLQKDDELQAQIDSLRAFCQEEVLGSFLAVLNLIFQKED